MTPDPERKIHRAAWASSLLFFAAFYALLVVLPVYLASAGLDAAATALVFGAFGVAGLVARPVAGRCTDRFGVRPVIVFGTLLFAGATLWLTSASSVLLLTLLRGAQAAGYVAFTTGATSMVALASDPATHAQVMARYGTAANVAMAGAPVAAGALLETLEPDVLILGIAVAALGALPFLVGVKARPRMPAPPDAVEPPGASGRRADSVLSVVFGMGFGAFLQFMPVLAYERDEGAGVAFTVFAVAIVATRIVLARKVDSTRTPRLVAPALVVLGAGLVLCAAVPGIVPLLLASALVAASCGVLHPTLIALHLAGDRSVGRAVGRFYFAFDVGIGAGAWLLAIPADRWGIEAIFVGSAVVLAVAAWLDFRRRARPGRVARTEAVTTGAAR